MSEESLILSALERFDSELKSERRDAARGSLYSHFDNMSWPNAGDALDDLEWNLRYGSEPNFGAASVVAAYRELLVCTRAKRENIISQLRKSR